MNGDVTAWKSSQVGPGKRFTHAALDQQYAQTEVQSSELQSPLSDLPVTEAELHFLQGATGATLPEVLATAIFLSKF